MASDISGGMIEVVHSWWSKQFDITYFLADVSVWLWTSVLSHLVVNELMIEVILNF